MSTFASKLNNFKLQKKSPEKASSKFYFAERNDDIEMQDNKMISMHRNMF